MTSGAAASHSQKRRILKNTAANGIAQAATMASTLIFLPLLVRSFGVSIYGVFVLATAVSSYALLLDLGVGATTVRMVAERLAKDDGTGAVRAIYSAATIYGALGLAAAAVMFSLGAAAELLFNVSGAEAALLRSLLWIGALQQVWYWPTTAARDALAGLQRYDLVSAVTLGAISLDIAGTIYVLATGQGPIVLVTIRAITMVVTSLISLVLLYRNLPGLPRRIGASWADMRAILQSGSSVFVLQIAQVMSRQQTDKLVLGVFVGTAAVTLYDIAAKLNSLLTTFSALTVSAILPVAAELNARNRYDSLRALFLRGTKIIASLIAPITTILIVIAAPFIAAWMGPGYEAAIPVAQILLLSQILLPLYQMGDQVMIGRNRFHLWVPGGVTLAVLNVVLSVVLVQRLGLIGVAIGTFVAVALEFPWYVRVFGRDMDLRASEWLTATAWPVYPLLLIPAAVSYSLATTPLATTLVGLLVVTTAAATLYWVVLAFVGYSQGDRRDLLAILRRRPREVDA